MGKWQDDWTRLLDARKKLPSSKTPTPKTPTPKQVEKSSPVSPKRFVEGMIEALRKAPTHQLSTGDMMVALRANGVTQSKSDDSLRTRISTEVRNHPQAGIERISRGIYGLARSAQLSASQPAEAEEVLDPQGAATEIMVLRRLNQRKAEAIMGLTRIIGQLVADE
jgi:hypothetical protein